MSGSGLGPVDPSFPSQARNEVPSLLQLSLKTRKPVPPFPESQLPATCCLIQLLFHEHNSLGMTAVWAGLRIRGQGRLRLSVGRDQFLAIRSQSYILGAPDYLVPLRGQRLAAWATPSSPVNMGSHFHLGTQEPWLFPERALGGGRGLGSSSWKSASPGTRGPPPGMC